VERLQAYARLIVIPAACALLFAGCSGASDERIVPGPGWRSGASQSEGLPARSPRSSAFIYVANFASNAVTVYPADRPNPKPVQTITNGVVAPRALWIDVTGTLYVTNDFGNSNPYKDTVTEFAPGGTSPVKVLTGLVFPGALAVDSKGTVYVQDLDVLNVYEGGSTTPTRGIRGRGNGASALTVDDADNVYALDTLTGAHERCYAIVVKIAPGASRGKRVGIRVPGCGYGIALDRRENVCIAYYGNNNASVIDVYHPGSHTPFRRITAGLAAPQQPAFGPRGTLYVPNDNNNTVTVYPAGSGQPSNTISAGLANPFSAAVWPPAPL
jgi:hypothetical protein